MKSPGPSRSAGPFAQYKSDGYCFGPVSFGPERIRAASVGMDDVMAGHYETGVSPLDWWWDRSKDDPESRLRKIDQPHLANRAIFDLISDRELGRWIATTLGVFRVQAWVVQLLYKPGTGNRDASVGWHQDYQYWSNWWTPDSEVFTCWLSLSEVEANCGPVVFVEGSHRWGTLGGGNFFEPASDRLRGRFEIPVGQSWNEIPSVLPAGAFSLHHRLTIHGSRPNVSGRARRSFAIHLRSENSMPLPKSVRGSEGHDYLEYLDDPEICPVLFDRSRDG